MDPAANLLSSLLQRMVDYERLRPTEREWDLITVESLLRRKDATVAARPAIQVAGSKGKGTTGAFLEALATGAGLRAGNYSSPHLITLCERIRIAGTPIRVECLEPILSALLEHAGSKPPTFFEAMTVAAVEYFAQQQVDLAIYEVGLGGRYDATTAIDIEAAIVTRIELEHTDVLGDTIAAIAGEKAAVIRPNGLGLTATTGEALEVTRVHAQQVEAELLVMGEDFDLHNVTFDAGGARGLMSLPDGSRHQFLLPDATAVDLPALALASAALSRLYPGLDLPLDPVPVPILPCRFEQRNEADGEALILDGAHTKDSLEAVMTEVQRRYPASKPVILTSFALGKRWQEALSVVLPFADSFVVTELTSTPGECPAQICAWLADQGAQSEVATDVAMGLRKLRERPGPRLVVGSFYLAGAVRLLVDAQV